MKSELKENAHTFGLITKIMRIDRIIFILWKNIKTLEQLCACLQIYESIKSVQEWFNEKIVKICAHRPHISYNIEKKGHKIPECLFLCVEKILEGRENLD